MRKRLRPDVVHQICWLLWPWLDDVKRQQFHAAFQRYHAVAHERGR